MTSRGSSRIEINWWALAAVVIVAIAGIVVLRSIGSDDDAAPAAARPDIPLDAWAPYWTLQHSAPELADHIDSLREVSPFWFNAVGPRTIEIDPNTPLELAQQFMEVARESDAALVPSVVDAMPAGEMAAILSDPATRARHVDALAAFAEDGDYDGLDIDYEQFAFADGPSTWDETRPAWVAFIEELGGRLHDDGRTLSVSIPPVYDAGQTSRSGFWVYDYGAIVDHVDRIRIMAYDFSVDEPGPIAPIDWVESAIEGAIEATEAPEKLVLGVPAYGRNWPASTTGDCPAEGVPGRTAVTARSVDGLIERRDATPEFDDDTAEFEFDYPLEVGGVDSDCVQDRQVHYVEGDGARTRMDLAREYGLSAAALWALGFEDQGVWDAIEPILAAG